MESIRFVLGLSAILSFLLLLHIPESFFFFKTIRWKQLYFKCILHYVVFCFLSLFERFETFVSELSGHLGVMGGARGLPAVCLSAFLASFVVPLRLCAQADLPSELPTPPPPSLPHDMPCSINSHL